MPSSPSSRCSGDASDPDMSSFCAYALMNLSPWNYYTGSNAGTHYPLKDFLAPAKERLLATINQTIGKWECTKGHHHRLIVGRASGQEGERERERDREDTGDVS